MKIAYGTYPMPTWPLEESLSFLAGVGYEGVEIMVGPNHVGTLPDQIDTSRREKLKGLLETFGLRVTAFHLLGPSVYRPDDETHERDVELTKACAQLARDLGVKEPPVIALGFGGRTPEWETIRDRMLEFLGRYGEVAQAHDFVLAGEAHRNAAVDRSERIVWLMERIDHPRIKLHFDIVHTFMAGEVIEDSVRTLVPYTGHTHWTDARRLPDGDWQLVSPGWGDLNTTRYVRAMYDAGWNDFITVEVSRGVWSKDDFDPVQMARSCYNVLVHAMDEAGVPRG